MPLRRRSPWFSVVLVALVGVAVLSLTAAAQAATVQVPIDVGAIAAGALKILTAGLASLGLWLIKGFVESFNKFKKEVRERFDTIEHSIDEVKDDVQTVTHELFGATGENGIRSEVREIKKDVGETRDLLNGREVLLARLADNAGIPFKEK